MEQTIVDSTARFEITKEVTDELLHSIQEIVNETRGKAGSIIQILQQVQEIVGFLPPPVLTTVARLTRIPLSEIYSIVSFYHFFSLVPKGKYIIQVCMGTSCYVKGGQRLLNTLKNEFGLESGGITPDGLFSLETVRCLGCCGLSPVMAVGHDVHRKIRASKIKDIIKSYLPEDINEAAQVR